MEKKCSLPETGYVRIAAIVGQKKHGIPGVIPVSKSTLWEWVRQGKFPAPVKISSRITCWKIEDIRAFIEKLNDQGGAA